MKKLFVYFNEDMTVKVCKYNIDRAEMWLIRTLWAFPLLLRDLLHFSCGSQFRTRLYQAYRLIVNSLIRITVRLWHGWTSTRALQRSLDWCYFRRLKMALNIASAAHITNQVLYSRGDLPRASGRRLAGYQCCHPGLPETKINNKII